MNNMYDKTAKKVNVFISHQCQEAAVVARSIKKELLLYSANYLQIIISEEIQPGRDQHQWIRAGLSHANVIIFLGTGPEDDWYSCLYEAGIFEGLKDKLEQCVHLCVLHSQNVKPPLPLENIASIIARPKEIEDFLMSFFGTSDLTGVHPPINETLAKSDLEIKSLSKKICRLFD